MPRINPVSIEDASPASRTLLEGVQKGLGSVPNAFSTLAHSSAALDGYLSFSNSLTSATLSAALREQIGLVVAGDNECDYCASAHTLLGKNAGVDDEELTRNLRGESRDARTRAALDFARAIVTKKGWVSDDDLAAVRSAGFSEGEIVEIVATVAINIFTNYFNHIADTEIDFPVVNTAQASAA